jgi:hypothetical protein
MSTTRRRTEPQPAEHRHHQTTTPLESSRSSEPPRLKRADTTLTTTLTATRNSPRSRSSNRHRNIGASAIEIDGRRNVDMRLIEGRDLQQVLADGPLEPGRRIGG